MDDVSGRTAQVWIRDEVEGEADPKHVVMQVYDPRKRPVGPEAVVRTRHDVIAVADEYGVRLDQVQFLGDSARTVDQNSGPSPA
ncbi:hypothetical protein [Streptacidiphilus carbonis]|uniref:hypothetical protein n=1 Tax=Streptacidiphilus carbonis TaxID=105422 RepID=UPI0005A82A7D|nr:hypothetical protein [Streptacidiphilus carbonis]